MATVGAMFSATSRPALSIKALKKRTGVSSIQLKQEIQESDLHIVAGCFDKYTVYLDKLVESAPSREDVKRTGHQEGSQSAMREALRFWKKQNPSAATYRALLEVTLELGEGDSAHKLCVYVANTLSDMKRDSDSDVSSTVGDVDTEELSDSSTDSHNLYMSVDKEALISSHSKTFTFTERDLQFETTNMQMKFAGLVTNVAMAMTRLGTTAEELTLFLSQIRAVDAEHSGTKQPKLLFNQQFVTHAITCATVGEVFRLLDGYYSWFNHLLIVNIIEAFCKHDRDILQRLQEYTALLKQYCKNRLCRVPRNGFNIFKSDCQQAVFKVDGKWDSMRVEAIDRVTATIAKILKLQRVALCLRNASSGCVELTYDIPKHLAVSVSKVQILALEEHQIRYSSGLEDPETSLTHRLIYGTTQKLKKFLKYDVPVLVISVCLLISLNAGLYRYQELGNTYRTTLILIALAMSVTYILRNSTVALTVAIVVIVMHLAINGVVVWLHYVCESEYGASTLFAYGVIVCSIILTLLIVQFSIIYCCILAGRGRGGKSKTKLSTKVVIVSIVVSVSVYLFYFVL